MCKFLLNKEADVNLGGIVSKLFSLSVGGCGRGEIWGWFVCVCLCRQSS